MDIREMQLKAWMEQTGSVAGRREHDNGPRDVLKEIIFLIE